MIRLDDRRPSCENSAMATQNHGGSSPRASNGVLVGALVLLASAGGFVLGQRREASVPIDQEPDTFVESVSIQEATTVGDERARVALVEFIDFECPSCASYARQVSPSVAERFVHSGQMLLVYMHLPLTDAHSRAMQAAEFAECAGRSGRFVEFHDGAFRAAVLPSVESLRELAVGADVRDAAIAQCDAEWARARIAEQLALAYDLGIQSTPTFLLGIVEEAGAAVRVKQRFRGVADVGEMLAAIEREISAVAQWERP